MNGKLIILFLLGSLYLPVSGEDQGNADKNLHSVILAKPEKPFYLAYDQPTDRYLVLQRDSFYYLFRDSIVWHKRVYETNQFDADLDFSLLKILNTKSKTYLVLWSGGYVYELKGNSIIRIDKSFNQHSQFGSSKFMMGDTIVSYGGYGFWNYQNFFTYLSPVTKEWELLELSSEHPLPVKRSFQNGFYDSEKRDFYIINGQTSKFTVKGPFETYELNDIWKINMDRRKWEKVGTRNRKLFIHYQFPVIEYNHKFLIIDYTWINEIDFHENRSRLTDIYKEKARTINKIHGIGYNPAHGEIIYLRWGDVTRPDEIRITPVEEFFSSKVTETWLYRNYRSTAKWIFIPVALLLVAWFVFRRFRKFTEKNNMLLLDSGSGELRFRNITINLDDIERKLLAELAKDGRYFNMMELFEIISDGQYSPEALKKQKMKIFNSINNKIDFVTKGENDIFLTRKNADDKRQVEVRINDGIVRIVR